MFIKAGDSDTGRARRRSSNRRAWAGLPGKAEKGGLGGRFMGSAQDELLPLAAPLVVRHWGAAEFRRCTPAGERCSHAPGRDSTLKYFLKP